MDFEFIPASNYSLPELVNLLNRGFEDYFIPIQFTIDMFSNMLRKDGIDLAVSRVLIADGQACGIALMASRPALRASRLAAMGIAKEARNQRAGSWLMQQLISEACARGDREMVLEVIEQNEPAVKLYRRYGFENVRRLVGYTYRSKDMSKSQRAELEEIDLREIRQLISRYGLSDLPWQLSAESVTQIQPSPHAYRHEKAYVVLSNPGIEHVVIWSLLVEPEARGKGLGTEMLKRLLMKSPGKTLHIPALCPEEFGKVFERAGFEKEELSQWQMKVDL